MSQRRERFEEALPDDLPAALDRLEEYYHVPVLGLLLTFMLWVRVRSWQAFVAGDTVLFNGNDAWYHLRQVSYTVRNWPLTMSFDPWTGFPEGSSVGQFGTLFDQLIATAAIIVGLGNPGEQTVSMVHLFAPAVFGTLTAIPVYYIGRRLGGRPAGLLAVFVLALTPGSFLRRSLVGFSDHHIAEVFFLSIGVLLVMVSVTAGERDLPIWELVAERDWETLRRPTLWSVAAGVGITLYLWTWPPGILLVVIVGTFYLLKLVADYLRGISPDHAAYTAAVTMSVVALLALLTIDVFSLTATFLSPIHVAFPLLVAVGAVFLAWLARQWDENGLDPQLYPVAVALLIAAIVGLVAVLLPETFQFLVEQAYRVVGYDVNAEARTVGEAQPVPLEQAPSFFYNSYGLAFYAAAVGLVYAVYRLYADGPRGELLLVLVLGVFMTMAALTQRRFDYYLAVPVAALSGYLLSHVIGLLDFEDVASVRDIESYQVLSVLAVVLLVMGPFVAFPASAGGQGTDLTNPTLTPVQVSGFAGPGEIQQWDPTLRWMANETPEEGRYANPDGEAMNYYGRFPRQTDYQYEEGSYGVMSWWDYGHFITVRGERIPYANPFQQHARTAAVYLLEPNASNANKMLTSPSGEETRYVMLDWKLAYPLSGKYSAPVVFYNNTGYPSNASNNLSVTPDLYKPVFNAQTGRLAFVANQERHYRSMRVRLYQYHGSRIQAQPVVVDWDVVTGRSGRQFRVTPSGPNATVIRQFRSMRAARQYVEEDGSSQIGGIGRFATGDIPALEHYRLVKVSETSAFRSRTYQQNLIRSMRGVGACQRPNRCLQVGQQIQPTSPQWVKAFERVPGAKIEGTGPPNTTVSASVRMEMPSANRTFTYRQQAVTDEDGHFEMTLPYSTTGYANWGVEEGYTNVSVRATGPYRISTRSILGDNLTVTRYNATVDVPESAVIGEDDQPIQVTLEKQVVSQPEGATTDTSSGDGSTNETNATSSDGSTDGENSTNTSSAREPREPPESSDRRARAAD